MRTTPCLLAAAASFTGVASAYNFPVSAIVGDFALLAGPAMVPGECDAFSFVCGARNLTLTTVGGDSITLFENDGDTGGAACANDCIPAELKLPKPWDVAAEVKHAMSGMAKVVPARVVAKTFKQHLSMELVFVGYDNPGSGWSVYAFGRPGMDFLTAGGGNSGNTYEVPGHAQKRVAAFVAERFPSSGALDFSFKSTKCTGFPTPAPDAGATAACSRRRLENRLDRELSSKLRFE